MGSICSNNGGEESSKGAPDNIMLNRDQIAGK